MKMLHPFLGKKTENSGDVCETGATWEITDTLIYVYVYVVIYAKAAIQMDQPGVYVTKCENANERAVKGEKW